MDKPIAFLEDYCTFNEDRVYVLMAIARKKENPEITSSSEPVFREVIKNGEDIRRKVEKLESIVSNYRSDSGNLLTFRLYITANARNTLKTYFNFRQRMNGWIKDRMYEQKDTPRKFKRIDSHWKSELHKPESRDETRFIFDLENVSSEELETFLNDLTEHVDAEYRVRTPNGFHIVTEPFNYNQFETGIEYELKTDGMVFLKFIDKAGTNEGDT